MHRIYRTVLLFALGACMVMAPAAGAAADRAYIFAIDISSSISGCTENIMVKNMSIFRQSVEALGKNDKVIVMAFGWLGKPAIIVNTAMPERGGGGGRLLAEKKREVLHSVSEFLKGAKQAVDDRATDIAGALSECSLVMGDLGGADISLVVFSDGQQTMGLPSSALRSINNIAVYGPAMEKYLQDKKIQMKGEVTWYGDTCSSKGMSHGEFAAFQGGIKRLWTDYLMAQGAKVDYHLFYN